MEILTPSVEDLVKRAKAYEKEVARDLSNFNFVTKIDKKRLIPDSLKRNPQPPENS
jgi:Ni,Fe-hydrogenase III component G